MTLEEIYKEANEKYKFFKTDCHLQRRLKRLAREDYIKKLMVKYGLIVEENKVNS